MLEKKDYQFEFKTYDFQDLKEGESQFLSDLTKFSKEFSDAEQLKAYVKFIFRLKEV